MDQRWTNFLTQEVGKEYFSELRTYIQERRKKATVIPDSAHMWDCFEYCPFGILKIVIIGAEPFQKNPGTGLAFSTTSKERPLALMNIFKEIKDDVYEGGGILAGVNPFETNDLKCWAEQGVLLINSCLTTEEGNPGAHRNKGWEILVENLLKYIDEKIHRKMVFMFWGTQAARYIEMVDKKHLKLIAGHPGAAGTNPVDWFGKRHFTTANNFIAKTYFNQLMPISWHTLIRNENIRKT